MFAMKFIAIFAFFIQIKAQDYCDRDLCRGRRHIACNNSGRWEPGCTGRMINVQSYINTILKLHNEPRNLIAAGRLSPFPSAVRMATMTWDPELARVATFNALRCRMEHDECRSTSDFRYAGQNLSIFLTRTIDIEDFLRRSIESWLNEYRHANRNDIESYRPRSGPAIRHFTAMVNERNNRIGCAIAQFTSSDRTEATYLVCNYAVTNIINNPVYRFGSAASECTTGRDSEYRSLCSTREPYDHNQWSR